jgi:general secretion pathway protein D
MRRAAGLLLALGAFGCASSSAFRAGEQAEGRRDYDRAVLEYARAVQQRPSDPRYRRRLEQARVRASEEHTHNARRLLGRGLFKEGIEELKLALDLNPSAESLRQELREAEAAQRQATLPADSIQAMKERARERSLPGLALGPRGQEPLLLTFRNASLKETYQTLGKVAGVNFIFDPQFQDAPVTLEMKDVPFEQALSALGSVGRTFHRVQDARVIMVIPDTPTKRREHEQQVVKTFFLSNADLKETIDLLRIVLGARRVAAVPGTNALTINDAPDKVAAAERIVEIVDKQRAEVVVEVEILEVNRTRLKEYGIEITSGIEGLSGVAGAIFPRNTIEEEVVNPDGTRTTRTRPLTLEDNPYRRSNLLITSLPGVIYRLLRTDGATRLLANPQLRTSEGQTAQARFGDLVPVPVTTFSPLAVGGTAQQPITSFEYKNVGVNIDLTPRVHHDGEVTLNLKLEISSVGPLFIQNLPTFNSRTVNSVIRLKDGETNILAGLISDTERKNLTGLPGLSSVPLLGKLLSRTRDEVMETDIVMTLTPHIVRKTSFTEQDLRSFLLGTETSPLLFEVPAIPPVAPSAPRPADPPRIEPIRPPSPVPAPSPLS